DALNSYGSPSYYVQKLFNHYLGNEIVPATVANIPVQNRPLTKKDSTDGIKSKTVPTIFYSATMNDTTGTIFLKVVNTVDKKQTIKINIDGAAKVSPEATMVVIKSDKPGDTNTISDPQKIVPVMSTVKGLKNSFSKSFPPYSVTIMQIQTR
ncbi:MAG: alpha-N-arabinofuranosidase, partial [Bacteroidota bacterium]|nr:alpha-N-arabinofuranosidase [Bacteroidota bacterium]